MLLFAVMASSIMIKTILPCIIYNSCGTFIAYKKKRKTQISCKKQNWSEIWCIVSCINADEHKYNETLEDLSCRDPCFTDT